jgi:hypothetical protein
MTAADCAATNLRGLSPTAEFCPLHEPGDQVGHGGALRLEGLAMTQRGPLMRCAECRAVREAPDASRVAVGSRRCHPFRLAFAGIYRRMSVWAQVGLGAS